MNGSIPITTLFLDIGGVLLTNGWDHQARRRAAKNFQLNLTEMEDRHHLTFDTYEEGKLTLEAYLDRVVFYQKRAFSRDQFRRFMFAQSKPFPKMIELICRLKMRYGLKVVVVSNEARDLNSHRISKVQACRICGLLCFILLRSRPQTRRGYLPLCAGHRPGAGPEGALYRQHPDVRPDRGRPGNSQHLSHKLRVHVRKAFFLRVAEWQRSHS